MASAATSFSVVAAIPSYEKVSPSLTFKPLPAKFTSKSSMPTRCNAVLRVQASMVEKMATGLTAGVLTAAMIVPDAAEAATGGSPSLQNFLYSILAGGVVLTAILGAVIGVSNFDPVKRT